LQLTCRFFAFLLSLRWPARCRLELIVRHPDRRIKANEKELDMAMVNGKVALVTGASRGIGRGVARELARQGAKVVVAARTMTPDEAPRVDGAGAKLPGSLQETLAEIEDAGGEALAVRCDLSDTGQIAALVRTTVERFGQLDILVNNAMPQDTFVGRFWELPLDVYDGQMTAGPRSYYAASWHAAPVMLEQGHGLIVNISSPGAIVDFYGAAYCIGRAASDRMAQALAHDLRPHGISVVSLWPTYVRTERVLIAAIGGNPGFDVPDDFDPSVDANSTDIVGTAIAHLAADPDVAKRSGKVLMVGDLAQHYGFKDIDGRDAMFNPPAIAMRRQRGYISPLAYIDD
jgi:dehydrogenase/reductase SDR family protein 1